MQNPIFMSIGVLQFNYSTTELYFQLYNLKGDAMNIKSVSLYERCPHCNSNLCGDVIPTSIQKHYGDTHFSRKIGIYDVSLDKTTHYICPDCNGTFDNPKKININE